jgi:hypothetical protein
MLITSAVRRRDNASFHLYLAIGLIVFLSGCGSGLATSSDETFWRGIQISGDEAEGYPTLLEMRKHADLVLIGSFASITLSRAVEADAAGDTIAYAAVTIHVEQLVSGSAPPGPLIVEFLLPTRSAATSMDAILSQVTELADYLPKEDMLLLLHEKQGTGEEGLYRLVNSLGLWTESAGSPHSPLYELVRDDEAPGEGDNPYAAELHGIDSIAALADYLSSQ